MSEIGRVIIFGIFVLSLVYTFIVIIIAYRNRKDRSFLGGASILQGWWVFRPYGESGIKPGNKKIVFHGRVSHFCLLLSIFALYFCNF